jgi:hypothetical protein
MSGKKPAAGIKTLWSTFKKTRDYSPVLLSIEAIADSIPS